MAALVKSIDQMLGCVPKTMQSHSHDHDHAAESANHGPSRSSHQHAPQTAHELLHSMPASSFPDTLDIQERYVERSREFDEEERSRWKKEGEELMAKASEMEKKRAIHLASTAGDAVQ